MEFGCGVGDGDERHHDEVWIGFALRCRWGMHEVVDLLVDCTVDSVHHSSLGFDLLRSVSFGFVWLESPLFFLAWLLQRLSCLVGNCHNCHTCNNSNKSGKNLTN